VNGTWVLEAELLPDLLLARTRRFLVLDLFRARLLARLAGDEEEAVDFVEAEEE